MKKVFLTAALFFSIGIFAIHAQESKTKPVTTPSDKVHNVIHRHHKIAHGVKSKHETVAGTKHVTTMKTSKAEALKPKVKKEEKH